MLTPSARGSVQRVVVALAVVGSSIYLGRAVATGSWQAIVAIAALGGSAVALLLGPRVLGLAVLGLVALPLYSQSYRIPLLWFAVFLWLVTFLVERTRGRKGPLLALSVPELVLPLLFLLGALLSDLTGTETTVQDVTSKMLALAAGVTVYYLVAHTFTDREWHRRALLALALGAVGVLAVGVFQLVVPSLTLPGLSSSGAGFLTQEMTRSTTRFSGPLGDYELMAEMLGLSSLILIGSISTSRGLTRALLVVTGGVAVVGVFMTGTRAGLVVLLLGAAILLIKHRPLTAYKALPLGVALSAAIAAAVVIALPDAGGVLGRISDIRLGGSIASTLNRAGVWSVVVDRISGSGNLLLGNGVEYDYLSIGTYPHSLYLYLLYTQGVVGFALFTTLLGRLTAPIVRALRESVPWDSLSLAPLLVLVFSVDEIKIEFTRLFGYQMWVWALLGLAASAIAVRRRERSQGVEAT